MSKWQINDHKTSITFNDEEKTRFCWVKRRKKRVWKSGKETILEFLPSIFIAQFLKSIAWSASAAFSECGYWNPEFYWIQWKHHNCVGEISPLAVARIHFTFAASLKTFDVWKVWKVQKGDKSAIKFWTGMSLAVDEDEDEIFHLILVHMWMSIVQLYWSWKSADRDSLANFQPSMIIKYREHFIKNDLSKWELNRMNAFVICCSRARCYSSMHSMRAQLCI